MRKKKKYMYLLIIILILGAGIGYAKIESVNGNHGFISIRRNRSYNSLISYTDNTAYYTDEIKAKVKRIVFNDEIGNDFTIPAEVQGEVMNVTSDGTDAIRAYLVPNASDANYSDLYIISNGFIELPANSSNLFAGFTNLTEIVNPSKLITNKITNMNSMFKGTKITSLNLAAWDTSKVTDMGSIFEDVNMTDLNISTWKFNGVTDTSNMFKNSTVTNLTLNNIEFNNDVDSTSMFENINTTSLNIKLLAKGKLTAPYIFKGATINELQLNEFEVRGNDSTITDFAKESNIVTFVGDNWKVEGVTSLNGLFKSAALLESVSMKNLKIADSDNYNMADIFSDDVKLETVDLSGLNGNTKVDLSNMFKNTTLLTNVNLSNITGIKALSLESFIQNSDAIVEINISSIDLSECTNYLNAFVDSELLTKVYVNDTYVEPTDVTFKGEGTIIATVSPEEPENNNEPTEP